MVSVDARPELWPVVTRDDRLIRYATEAECHGTPPLLHRTTFVLARNGEGKVLLQQRSLDKRLYPGFLTMSATGHNIGDESYESTARRETLEELGVRPDKLTEVWRGVVDAPGHLSHSVVFLTELEGSFTPRAGEVEEVRFYDQRVIKALEQRITPPSRFLLKEIGLL